MAKAQTELRLPPPSAVADENEQECEARLWEGLRRVHEDVADEVGRARLCYALHLSEQTLSKKLRGIEDKIVDARILLYLLKHEKIGRLARAVAEYAGFLPFQRPEALDAEEALREIVALALAGETGRAAAEKIQSIYSRTQKRQAAR